MRNKYEIRGNTVVIFLRSKIGTLETVIDLDDFPLLCAIDTTWFAIKGHSGFYAKGNVATEDGKRTEIALHRIIMNAKRGELVDHKNHDTLDNRKSCNLRLATRSENMQNRKGVARHNKSGYRGVYWHKQKRKWYARGKINNKTISLGFYDDPKEAGEVARKWREENMPFSKEYELAHS